MNSINSLYLHFPFCKHLCNYCDFYKHKLESINQIEEYEVLLAKQFSLHEKYLADHNCQLTELETFYLGGGTPSLWGTDGVDFIQSLLDHGKLSLQKDCEFTLEVDPDAWTEQELEKWINLGANRFSIGSQAFNEKMIKQMDRLHKLSDVEKTIKYFSDRRLNYSVDLMLGLPNSSARNLKQELSDLLDYRPNHISVYILKTRKNYPFNDFLPADEQIRCEYLQTSEILRDAGFDHYEVSNFARDGFYSRHNLKYWNYASVAAIGPNATGLIVEKDKAIRYQWKSVSLGVTEEILTGESLVIEKLFLGLRSSQKFDLTALFSGQESKLAALHESWQKQKFLKPDSHVQNVQLAPEGFLMCDTLIDDIFREIQF